MEFLIYGLIGLFVSYFIIYLAVKDAIEKKMERALINQNGYLRFLVKHAGATPEDIDRIQLTEKEFKKKYKDVLNPITGKSI